MSRAWKIRFNDGRAIRGTSDVAYIGNGNQCEIHFSNNSEYEDCTFAVLLRNDDYKSWRIVRIDDTADIRISGEQLHLVHYLNEKDMVSITEANAEFRFVTEEDRNISDASHIVKKSIWASVAAVCFILFVVGTSIFLRNLNIIGEKHIEFLKNSICKITVDEVLFQQVDTADGRNNVRTIASLRLESSSCSGTGFFCKDGRFITARHCIEPWITLPMTGTESLEKNGELSEVARWASACETFNHTKDSASKGYQRVISLCTIKAEHKNIRHKFSTDTCMFCTDNDIIRNLGGPKDRILWRETGNVKLRSALGDITYVKTDIYGAIQLAPQKIANKLRRRMPVAHWGFRADKDEAEFKSGEIAFDFNESGKCIEHKSSEGMQKGFSGGPAMIRHHGQIYAVGVISKIGDDGKETYFSVPVTEIEKAKRRW